MDVQTDMLARRLRDAYSGGAVQPLRDGLDPLDVAGAYAIQATNARVWSEAGVPFTSITIPQV